MSRGFAGATVSGHALLLAYSLNLFLGFIFLCNSLKIVYYFAARERVVNIVFFSQPIDQSVWLLSLLAIIVLLLKLHRTNRLPRRIIFIHSIYAIALACWSIGQEHTALTVAVLTSIASLIGVLASAERSLKMPTTTASALFLIYFLLPFIIIETGSAIALIVNPFHPAQPVWSDSTWLLPPVETNSFIHVETEISNVAYPATPHLMLLLFYSWAWIPLGRKLSAKIDRSGILGRAWPKHETSIKAGLPDFRGEKAEGDQYPMRLGRTNSVLILGCVVAVGGFLVLSPYISQSRFVGVDSEIYHTLLTQMVDLEAARKIILEDAGPKATYFLLLYLIKALTGLSAMTVVKIAAVIPASLLPISAYLLLRYASRNDSLAMLSSLIAVLSFSTTVGMFSGIYANWLALSFMMLSFALLIKASTQNSRRTLLASVVVSSLVLLTHALSWMIFMAVVSFYSMISLVAFSLRRRAEPRRDFLFSLLILLVNGALALFLLGLSSLFSVSLSASLVVRYATHSPVLAADSLSRFPHHLWRTMNEYVGGFLANPLIYFLAVAGTFQRGYSKSLKRVLSSWLITTSIAFPLVTSLDQWRILYLMPIQILAALGVFELTKKVGLLVSSRDAEEGSILSRLLEASLLCVITLSLFNYTARSINLLFLLFRP